MPFSPLTRPRWLDGAPLPVPHALQVPPPHLGHLSPASPLLLVHQVLVLVLAFIRQMELRFLRWEIPQDHHQRADWSPNPFRCLSRDTENRPQIVPHHAVQVARLQLG